MLNTTKTVRAEGSYNVSIWRVCAETGEVISVQAGLFAEGKILRAGGKFSYLSGLPEFHGEIVGELSTFAGKPCFVVVTDSTDGVRDGLRMRFAAAFAKARELARFEAPRAA